MKQFTRGAVVLALAVMALIGLFAALVPLSNSLIEQWARRDVELRSELVFNSIRDRVEREIAGQTQELIPFFQRLTTDERIMALGLCDAEGRITVATPRMPRDLDCRIPGAAGVSDSGARFIRIRIAGERVLIGVFPIAAAGQSAHLVILHELGFVADRIGEARWYLVIVGLALLLLVGAVAALIVGLLQRRYMRAVLSSIQDLKTGRPARSRSLMDPRVQEESREIRGLLRDFREKIRQEDGTPVEWSPSTLQDLLEKELPDAEVFVVSNREPYIHNRDGDKVVVQRPASGLVSALEPVMRACGGVWVAHGSGSADRETVDADDHVAVPPGKPAYRLRRVWISEEEQEGYYYGLANEGLWPLCHLAYVRPIFREADWNHYVAVNQRFADAVVREATRPDPVVMVQDYHFALLPRMIREQLPKATILTFWHIPWPNAEAFGICPWKEEIIAGLLGSTVLGFHTQAHCNNFFETVDRFMESRIDREHRSVVLGGEETMVRPYPISIEWPPAALLSQQPVAVCRQAVRERYGLAPDMKIGVGIERFDYTKGILDRLQAIDELLIRQPEWKGRFTFIQIVAPTRSKLASYTALQEDAVRITAEVNARHGGEGYQPIHLVIRHHEPEDVYELFRAADICVVSSLHDGMNLVAKEFVAARDDEQGALVLSRFAGASSELSEALIINPFDVQGMAEAIGRALLMPEAEQRERMRLMRSHVRERNVYRWAGQILLDASRLRKRQRVQEFANGD
ncbi:alpha,alpha-trehalose-phosphate synthase (UDP-forming) [Phreatobacter cathodiphilus]|uniref:Trehalose-6-phosphate synthase n=1 Tax=Phreatobacter cathodiphilus TaxID=1868589 RepID=A0A2S0NF42_9HYPH|nr:trehalose-6-phosphate synthase [Phreatobacter cathodiphilus]AVO46799.1 trehalose-6-phosphate synthase [Phreatobacter cathodiphilus]